MEEFQQVFLVCKNTIVHLQNNRNRIARRKVEMGICKLERNNKGNSKLTMLNCFSLCANLLPNNQQH